MAPKGKGSKEKKAAKAATAKAATAKAATAKADEQLEDAAAPVSADRGAGSARDAATTALDKALVAFRTKMKGKPATYEALKEAFTTNQLATLWGRLKGARRKGDMSLEEAWKSIDKMAADKQKSKQKILAEFCVGGEFSEGWRGALMTMQEQVTVSQKRKETLKPLYRGELEAQHGAAEAMAFIAKGKYREVYDKQGDVQYVKVSQEFEKSGERKRQTNATRSGLANPMHKA